MGEDFDRLKAQKDALVQKEIKAIQQSATLSVVGEGAEGLLPCPFCNVAPVVEDEGEFTDVACYNVACFVQPRALGLKDYPAHQTWNRRPTSPAVGRPVGADAPERIWIEPKSLRVGHGYIYPMNPDNADFDAAPVEYVRQSAVEGLVEAVSATICLGCNHHIGWKKPESLEQCASCSPIRTALAHLKELK